MSNTTIPRLLFLIFSVTLAWPCVPQAAAQGISSVSRGISETWRSARHMFGRKEPNAGAFAS